MRRLRGRRLAFAVAIGRLSASCAAMVSMPSLAQRGGEFLGRTVSLVPAIGDEVEDEPILPKRRISMMVSQLNDGEVVRQHLVSSACRLGRLSSVGEIGGDVVSIKLNGAAANGPSDVAYGIADLVVALSSRIGAQLLSGGHAAIRDWSGRYVCSLSVSGPRRPPTNRGLVENAVTLRASETKPAYLGAPWRRRKRI